METYFYIRLSYQKNNNMTNIFIFYFKLQLPNIKYNVGNFFKIVLLEILSSIGKSHFSQDKRGFID